MKKKLFAFLAVIMLLAVVVTCFVACDKKGDDDNRPVVVVGYTLYKPMNYTENGELVGFDTELAKAVFNNLGYRAVFKEIQWENKYLDLESGTINCIWNGFTSNQPEEDGTIRSELVDFSYNYMINAQAVVVRTAEAANYTSIETSFANKRGYVESGSAGATYAAGFTGAIVSDATSQMDAVMQVNTGAADFAVVDYLLAKSITGKGDFANLTYVQSLNSEEEHYAIGFKKGDALRDRVNGQLVALAIDGTMAKIAAKYELSNAVVLNYCDQINA